MTTIPYQLGLMPSRERTGRRLLAGLVLATLAVTACGGARDTDRRRVPRGERRYGALPDKGSITLLTWEGYTQPEWLAAYKEKTGVEVNVITAGSVDEMFAKAQASAGQIDITHFDFGQHPALPGRRAARAVRQVAGAEREQHRREPARGRTPSASTACSTGCPTTGARSR